MIALYPNHNPDPNYQSVIHYKTELDSYLDLPKEAEIGDTYYVRSIERYCIYCPPEGATDFSNLRFEPFTETQYMFMKYFFDNPRCTPVQIDQWNRYTIVKELLYYAYF